MTDQDDRAAAPARALSTFYARLQESDHALNCQVLSCDEAKLESGELWSSCRIAIERSARSGSDGITTAAVAIVPKLPTIPFLASGVSITTDEDSGDTIVTLEAAIFPGVYIEDQLAAFHQALERALDHEDYRFCWRIKSEDGYEEYLKAARNRADKEAFKLPAGGIFIASEGVDLTGITKDAAVDSCLHRWVSALLDGYLVGVEQALHYPIVVETERKLDGHHDQFSKATVLEKQLEQLGGKSECEKWMALAGMTFSVFLNKMIRPSSCDLGAGTLNLPDPPKDLVPCSVDGLTKVPRQFRPTALAYMTDRRVFIDEPYMVAATRGRTLPRPPIWIHRQAGRYLPEYHEVKAGRSLLEITADPPSAAALTMQPINRYGMDAAIIYSDILIIPQALGMGLQFNPAPIFDKHIETDEDVDSLVFDPKALEITMEALRLAKKQLLEHDAKKFSQAQDAGKRHTSLVGFCGAPITVMDYMTGKTGMVWIKTKPEATSKMLKKITDASIEYLSRQISEGGADIVQVFDSSGGSFDKETYMKWGFPSVQRMALELKTRFPYVPVQVFPRGATHAISAYVHNSLYDTISLDEVMTPEEARATAGPYITLQGNFSCDLMYEKHDTIVMKGQEMVRSFNQHGHFKRHHIVNLSHGMRPDMSPESVTALVEAVQTIHLGSRQSPLALAQARIVEDGFILAFPQHRIKITAVKTKGDKILDVPLSRIGGDKGLFTKELEWSLIKGEVDLVQHSLKDLETITPPGLRIVAMMPRADRRDAVVMLKEKVTKGAGTDTQSMSMIPQGAVVGTSSVRRLAQLKLGRPDLEIRDVRGNLNTRLRKLVEGQYDALILACAGLDRLPRDTNKVLKGGVDMPEGMPADHFDDLLARCTIFRLDESEMVPAVGQGVLAVQTRDSDFGLNQLLGALDDFATRRCATEERAFLRELEGGCQVPIGVSTYFDPNLDVVTMKACVFPTPDSGIQDSHCEG